MNKEAANQVNVSKIPKKEAEKDTSKTNPELTKEINGRSGPEPTRYGDWEKNGRCIDF